MTPNAIEAALAARQSCRAFLPHSLPRETITRILDAAQNTASWNNTQPWQVQILSGAPLADLAARLTKLAAAGTPPAPHIPFPTAYTGDHALRRRACGYQLYDAVGVARGDKPAYARQTLRNFAFFDAPHLALVTAPRELGTYGVLDCGAWIHNFMLAAQSLGVATIAQGALAQYADAMSLPQDRMFVAGIAFGLADTAHPVNAYRVPRAPLSETVTWLD